MSTPEGKVKAKISKVLRDTPDLYYEMVVPGGYGKSGLDYSGCYYGRAFYIEAKRPGEKPTPRQETTIAEQRRARAKVFVIDGDVGELVMWLAVVRKVWEQTMEKSA